ncbi:hypothetical protein E4T66_17735 [Sinimarinibacterium sp. CAU 1509]|uniref:hypothetical protein n=1 Tax=Sinimarinibacterium sp. CAU 1509 TaxID=2562283 RepID=UPI0010AD22A0|nr:hypothetical protein [Sinimarinibacterium sp. CAU 1509]TJY57249.1 hypothetical protein E4T66_17735 [Sinimarinibacterium sp. CAU 1509]
MIGVSTSTQTEGTVLHCALVIGATQTEGVSRPFVLRHAFDTIGGQKALGAGHLIDASAVTEMLQLLHHGDGGAHGSPFLAADVVALAGSFAAWVVPSAVRPMWITTQKGAKAYKVQWPHLVVATAPGRVWVAAVPHAIQRGDDVPVFHAPLMNVGTRGQVCLPAGLSVMGGIAGRAQAESALFDTKFSHVNHPHTLRLSGKGKAISTTAHHGFWRRKARAQEGASASEMVAMNMRLSQWVSATYSDSATGG